VAREINNTAYKMWWYSN